MNNQDQYTNGNDVSEAARLLSGMRRIVEGTCAVCGKPFTGTRKRRYCSHTCAQRAHWAAKTKKAKETNTHEGQD